MKKIGRVEPVIGTMRKIVWDEGMLPKPGTVLYAVDESEEPILLDMGCAERGCPFHDHRLGEVPAKGFILDLKV